MKKLLLDNKYIIFMFIIYLFLHLFMIGKIPNGIHIDEASISLNAKNIVEYGIDAYGNKYPIYMQCGENAQSSLPTYLIALSYAIFGYSILSLRLPFVLLGCLFYIFFVLILKEIFNKEETIIGCSLITCLPYFIMVFRWSLDCNSFITFLTISLYFYLKSIKNKKKYWIVTGILFGLTLYTYVLSWIFIPLFLLLSFIVLYKNKKQTIKEFLLLIGIVGIIGLPLIYYCLLLIFPNLPEITNPISIVRCGNRLSEFSFNNIFSNIILGFFNTLFNDPFTYSSYPLYFTMYIISIPLIIFGFIKSIKNKEIIDKIVLILLICHIFIMIIVDFPNISRLNTIFICYIYYLIIAIKNIKYKKIIMGCYIICTLIFISFYFNQVQDIMYFDNGFVKCFEDNYDENINIYIDKNCCYDYHTYIGDFLVLNQEEYVNLEQNHFTRNIKELNELQLQPNSIYILGNYNSLEYINYNEEYIENINEFIENNREYIKKQYKNYYIIKF